jgi:gliding motility-associated lipoprotein GldB
MPDTSYYSNRIKNLVFLTFALFLIVSCNKKNKIQEQVEAVEVNLKVVRFDKIFYETPVEDFQAMRTKFSSFFPVDFPDSVFTNKMTDPLYRELYSEVQNKYSDFSPVQSEIEDVFRYIKFYFPEKKTPSKVTTVISEMDFESKVIYNDTILLISLDLYLGKDHKFYEFPNYFEQTFERSQIMPDIVSDFSTQVIQPPLDKTLLSQMIYFGKEMYLKDMLLPDYSDFDKMGYTKEQNEWSIANENEIWRYFIDQGLLFDTNSDLVHRFITPAPFSKFYLEIDNESPGRIGAWIGWQIVRSFMNNNDVSVQQLMTLDAREVFERSKYKPKK